MYVFKETDCYKQYIVICGVVISGLHLMVLAENLPFAFY